MNFINTKLKKAFWLILFLLVGYLTDWALFIYGGALLAIFFGLKIALKMLGWVSIKFFTAVGIVYQTIINDIGDSVGRSVAEHTRKDNN